MGPKSMGDIKLGNELSDTASMITIASLSLSFLYLIFASKINNI